VTESSSIQQIPLNKLTTSALNVRKKDRKADIDALAASILAHGLLQNLNVVASDDGKFEVVAGGRRLAALKALVKVGAISRDYSVSCKMLPGDLAREASLAENIQRVDMDVMDEVEAYAQLVDDGESPEGVARRFGVTLRHVQQRLALAKLSPKIKGAWKRGEITLDAARAFCLVEDHAQQEAVFRSLGKPVTHASTVRARLMGDRMRASDRLAIFVGLEAYEAAGGAIVRDLFDEDAVYIGDPALIAQLAEQKLEMHRTPYAEAGWGWVDVNLAGGSVAGMRIQPDWRAHTPEEEAELVRLRGEMDALDEALDADSIEEDPRWDTRDDLAAQIETLRQSARVWDPALMALAGVVLCVSHAGELNAICGVVRAADEKALRDVRKARQQQDAETDDASRQDETPEAVQECGLPKALIRDLSLARTRAIRFKLATDVDASLALAVAAMIQRQRFHSAMPGVDVSAHATSVEDFNELQDAIAQTEGALPAEEADVLSWCLDQSREVLLGVLALVTAHAVDLTHERGGPGDRARQSLSDRLCEALRIDMKEFWQADDQFWSRLPKSELLQVLRDSPAMDNLKEKQCETQLKALGKLKKDELAARAAAAYSRDIYVPDMFIVEPATGAFAVTRPVDETVAA
jgi:ParB family chromosome partitioning protein